MSCTILITQCTSGLSREASAFQIIQTNLRRKEVTNFLVNISTLELSFVDKQRVFSMATSAYHIASLLDKVMQFTARIPLVFLLRWSLMHFIAISVCTIYIYIHIYIYRLVNFCHLISNEVGSCLGCYITQALVR